jgi:disulfide bond formation protein DsbB
MSEVLPADRRRLVFAAILAISAGVLVFALVAEHVAGIEPCLLCLYERIPYLATAVIAAWALAFRPRPAVARWLGFACAGVLAAGTVLAGYHVGVENHWWAAPAACGGAIADAGSLVELLNQPDKAALRPCDADVTRIFGVSLAGWNVAASLILALALAIAATRLRPRAPAGPLSSVRP